MMLILLLVLEDSLRTNFEYLSSTMPIASAPALLDSVLVPVLVT